MTTPPPPPAPASPTQSPPAAPLADGRWHRVHPLTPILKSGVFVAALVGILTSRVEDMARSVVGSRFGDESASSDNSSAAPLLVIVGALVAILVLGALLNWVLWRKHEFLIDHDSVHLRKGLINKQQRKARLDRVQAIDLNQPLVARLLGLAQVSFDVAGGKDANFEIEYLRRADAEALRDAMLARSRVSRETSNAAGSQGASPIVDPTPHLDSDDQSARRPGATLASRVLQQRTAVIDDLNVTLTDALAPYRVTVDSDEQGRIVRVPPHRLAAAMLLTPGPAIAALVVALLVGVIVVGAVTGYVGEALSVALPLFFALLAMLQSAVSTFLQQANFSVAVTGDGLVVTQGLTSTVRRVIPVDRVQAVELKQPWLWRRTGWWRVRMNLATGAVLGEQKEAVLLPVGSLDDAMMLMGLVLPDPGTPEGVTGRDLMVEAMTASTTSSSRAAAAMFTGPGRHARLLDPLTAKREAWARTASMVVIRSGRLVRRVACVPHARVQSMALVQGPVQRRLGLATVELHSTQGPITPELSHLDADAARAFFADHAAVTRQARQALDGR